MPHRRNGWSRCRAKSRHHPAPPGAAGRERREPSRRRLSEGARAWRAAAGIGFAALALAFAAGRAPAADDDLTLQLRAVADVRFEGRHEVNARELRAVLKTRRPSRLPWADPVPLRLDYVRADTALIAGVYRQRGYLDVRVGFRIEPSRDPGRVRVIYTLDEGRRSTIASVEFRGATVYPEDQLRRRLYARPGRPFNPAFLVVDTTRISAAYQDRGYLPHVQGDAERESLDVHVRYVVSEGPLYRFGEVYLSTPGRTRVNERLVRRELLFKPGDVYRRPRLERSMERLYETGLFSQVQMTPLPDSANARIEVDLRVSERKVRWVDAGVGSGTSERLQSSVEWGHRNISGRGLLGAVAGRAALDGDRRFRNASAETRLVEPWLLGTRTRGAVLGYLQRRDDRTDPRWVIRQRALGLTFGLNRELNRFTRIGVTQDNQWVRQSLETFEKDLADSTEARIQSQANPRYTTHRITFALDRDLRDSPFLPTRGSIQNASVQIAGGPLRGSSSFRKYELASSWYTPTRTGMVFAARFRGGLIYPYGQRPPFTPEADVDPEVARVPTEHRFRLGGVNSIRGFDENSIPIGGGLAELLGSVELRVPIKGPFGLELYADAGNVWARPSAIRMDQFRPALSRESVGGDEVRYVFGFGPRMDLPIGPLRLDVTFLRSSSSSALVAVPQFAIGPSF